MTDHEPSKEKDPRTLSIEARKKRMKELSKPAARVRVTPGNDDMRRVLKHPSGVGFAEAGSTEWPHDQFTRRRIQDGSVKVEEHRADEHRTPDKDHRTTARRPSDPAAA
jgi:hypothetical protein